MKGPTGVGKTEIARRLAKLVKAPFVKVEATKFTEVGYVGRDVESIVRDLVEAAIRLVREEKYKEVQPKVQDTVETKLVNLILPLRKQAGRDEPDIALKEEILQELRKGNLDKLQISVEAVDEPKTCKSTSSGTGNQYWLDFRQLYAQEKENSHRYGEAGKGYFHRGRERETCRQRQHRNRGVKARGTRRRDFYR